MCETFDEHVRSHFGSKYYARRVKMVAMRLLRSVHYISHLYSFLPGGVLMSLVLLGLPRVVSGITVQTKISTASVQ